MNNFLIYGENNSWKKKSLYEKNIRSRIVFHDLILCDPVTIINSQCPATTSIIICIVAVS